MTNDFYYLSAEARQDQLVQIGRHSWLLVFGYFELAGQGYNWRKDYNHQPTKAELKSDIDTLINAETDAKILSGYEWDGQTVWLSVENQLNYKTAYDLAVQTSGATLPVTVKVGQEDAPTYVEFSSVNELGEFYMGAVTHIQGAQKAAWKEKDGVDYEQLTIKN